MNQEDFDMLLAIHHQCRRWKICEDGKFRCWCGCEAPVEG